MKNVLSLILVTVLLSLCVLPAFATDITKEDGEKNEVEVNVSHVLGKELNTNGDSEDVTVYSGEISQSFMVTIPDVVTLKEKQAVEATITATEVVIDKNKTITVTVTSENYNEGWKIKDTVNDKTLTYSIKNNDEEVIDGGTAVSFTHIGQKAYEENISFELLDKPPYIGTYTDTLTFTVTVGE